MKNLDILDRHTINLLNQHDLLKKLIRSELIEEQVYSGECDSQELESLKNKIKKEYNVENLEELKSPNTKLDDSSIRENILMEKFLMNNFENKVEEKFLEIKNSLDEIVYSIIRVRNTFLAQELYLKLVEDNISFGELAREYSLGHEKETRGIIGPGGFDNIHPILRDILRTSEIGQINEPINIEGWCIISRMEDFKPATLDDKTKFFIRKLLFNEWLDIKVSEELLNIQNKLNTVS